MVELILKDIEDVYSRENFFRLSKFFNQEALLNGNFKFFEVVITAANTTVSIPHGLNFIPQDIIFLSVDGNYNFYFEYANFDKTNLKIFVEGPCKLRFFAGAYKDQNYGRRVSDLVLIPPNSAGGASTTWFTGIGTPSAGLGSIGDFYLDTSTGDIYLKTAPLTWTLEGSIALPHAASDITLDTAPTSNTVVGVTVQEYIDRFNEPSVSESPDYNVNGTVNYIEYFSSPVQVVANRIFRVDLTYDGDLQPLTETWLAYSKTDGTTVLKTVAMSYTWSVGQLTNKTQVTT
jgi:hypothetical protein